MIATILAILQEILLSVKLFFLHFKGQFSKTIFFTVEFK